MHNPFKQTKYENACLSKIDFDEDQMIVLQDFLKNPKNFLYVYSDPGVGKTYFSAAVTNMRIDEQKKYCWYQDENDFWTTLCEKMNNNQSSSSYVGMMAEQDFLILDDLGSLSFSEPKKMEWLRSSLFALIDQCGKYRTPLIITSNYSPEDLKSVFHPRFVSRILATENKILKLKGPDKRLLGL